jgi:hypothetical protein
MQGLCLSATPDKCRKCLGRDVDEEIGKYAGTLGAPTNDRPPISQGEDMEPDSRIKAREVPIESLDASSV